LRKKLLIFVMIFVIGIMAACSNSGNNDKENDEMSANGDIEDENFHKEGFPIVDEPIKLEFMTGKAPTTAEDYNEVLIWQEYEDMTNIEIDWGLTPKEGLTEKRNLSLGSENLPDAYHTAGMPVMDLLKYGEQGTFVELSDLIEEYMPNLTEVLDEYPDIRKGITFPDGGIYGIPTVYDPDFPSLLIGAKFWIREDWLKELDMDVPETTDEYYEYLKAVKETDLLGDGSGDEIPFGATTISQLRQVLTGAFGVQNMGRKHSYIDKDPETGDVRFFPIDDGYKEMLEYLNKIFEEELIQENIYTIEKNQSISNGSEGLYGSTIITSTESIYGEEEGSKFIGMPALEGPHGDREYTKVGSPIAHMGGFVITKENDHVPETLRWLDYFYSEEGTTMFFMGIEGETFEEKEDGIIDYMDDIKNSADDSSLEQELAKYVTYLGGGYPGIVMQDSFKGAESLPSSIKAAEKIEPYIIDEIWPTFTYTTEENKKLSSIQSDLHKYVDEMQDKFITGAEPFSEWDSYVKKVESMRLDEYLEIQQAAVDRYYEN